MPRANVRVPGATALKYPFVEGRSSFSWEYSMGYFSAVAPGTEEARLAERWLSVQGRKVPLLFQGKARTTFNKRVPVFSTYPPVSVSGTDTLLLKVVRAFPGSIAWVTSAPVRRGRENAPSQCSSTRRYGAEVTHAILPGKARTTFNKRVPVFSTYPPVSVSGTDTLLLKVVRAFPGSIAWVTSAPVRRGRENAPSQCSSTRRYGAEVTHAILPGKARTTFNKRVPVFSTYPPVSVSGTDTLLLKVVRAFPGSIAWVTSAPVRRGRENAPSQCSSTRRYGAEVTHAILPGKARTTFNKRVPVFSTYPPVSVSGTDTLLLKVVRAFPGSIAWVTSAPVRRGRENAPSQCSSTRRYGAEVTHAILPGKARTTFNKRVPVFSTYPPVSVSGTDTLLLKVVRAFPGSIAWVTSAPVRRGRENAPSQCSSTRRYGAEVTHAILPGKARTTFNKRVPVFSTYPPVSVSGTDTLLLKVVRAFPGSIAWVTSAPVRRGRENAPSQCSSTRRYGAEVTHAILPGKARTTFNKRVPVFSTYPPVSVSGTDTLLLKVVRAFPGSIAWVTSAPVRRGRENAPSQCSSTRRYGAEVTHAILPGKARTTFNKRVPVFSTYPPVSVSGTDTLLLKVVRAFPGSIAWVTSAPVRRGRENAPSQCSSTRRYGAEVTHAILPGKARTTFNKRVPVFSTYPPVSVSGTDTLLLKVVRAFPGSIAWVTSAPVRRGRENAPSQCSSTRRYGAEVTHAILPGKARTTFNKRVPVFSTYPPVSVSGTDTLLLKVVRAFPGSIAWVTSAPVRRGRENAPSQCSSTRRYGAEVTHAILPGKARTTFNKRVPVFSTYPPVSVSGTDTLLLKVVRAFPGSIAWVTSAP
ncbi:hypothetical protein F383_34126 [Gossypium arboreum]|uniref:Uncharacterized protein n=3 Tax=Magnoliopsida TaxID=3398 RepID=A0A0B0PL95_GOSAR|nr:hypothetical protein F383_34126 [Gossypium arboreum]